MMIADSGAGVIPAPLWLDKPAVAKLFSLVADDPELIAQFERHGVEAMRHLVAGDRFPNQIMPLAAKWLGEQERQANLVAAQQRSAEWAEQQRIAAKTLWVSWLGAGAGIVAAISGIVAAVASVWALLPRK